MTKQGADRRGAEERKTSDATALLIDAAPDSQSFSESKHFLIIQHEERRDERESCSKPTGSGKAQIEKHSNGKTLLATSNILFQQAVLNAKDTINVRLNSQGHIL